MSTVPVPVPVPVPVDPVPLHVRLRETRLHRGMTVVRLAKLFGLKCHETLTAWESGPDHRNGWKIPREWAPLVIRWIDTGVEPSKEETKLARQQLVVIGSLSFDEPIELNKPKVRRSPAMTWKTFRKLFMAEGTLGAAPRTLDDYRHTLDCFERVAKPKRIAAVTARSLTKYAAHLRDFGRSPATINHHLRVVKRVLSWAHEQKLLPDRPHIRMLRVPKKLPRIVSEAEFQRLLAATPDHRWSAFFLTAVYSGMRLGELLALEWADIDFVGMRILLRAEVNKARSDEWIPLHAGLVPVLQSLDRGSPKVFCLVNGITNVSNRVRQIGQSAGLTLFGMHTLRRSCASWLAAKGVPLQIVQRLLRHSDPRVTMSYYTNVESELSAAIAKLPATSIEQAGFKAEGGAA